MRRQSPRRDFLSLIVSAVLHVSLVLALALIPNERPKQAEFVDLEVVKTKPPTPPEPEPEELTEEEPPEEKEPEKPKPPKKKPKPMKSPPPEEAVKEPEPLKPPDAEEADPDAEEAPPVFDLGDNTFAKGEGQGAGWSLNRSEGNTKFAGVAKKDAPSARNTKPGGSPNGVPGGTGTGYRPTPLKNLSKRPELKGGTLSPPYPMEAKREGIEGSVVLQVFIDRTGRVRQARVIRDPGGGLGLSAQKAMLAQQFTPAIDKNGNRVDTVIVFKVHFVLES